MAQPWPAPDTTFPLNNWSQFAQGLLKTFLFSCAASAEPLGRCNSRSPAAAAAASQKRLSISPPTLSTYTFVANKTLLWHLEFEIACMHRHVENRLWSFSFFQHFPLRSFWAKMPLRWTQSVWAGGLLPESTSTVVKLQCMSSWSGFPVVPDTYARVPSNSETHRRKKVFQSKNPQKKILILNICSFRFDMTN